MNPEIEAIFLDVGNTLRILTPNEEHQSRARRRIVELLDTNEDPDEFIQKVDERYKVYRKWAFANMKEAPEPELWTRWLAPEFPAEKVAALGQELTYQYRQSMGLRVMVENGREVVAELHRRGYTLGLISNVITSKEIPDWLEADNLAGYFKSVVLSSVMGIRKPDPEIYYAAARRAGTEPAKCVYVGDNLQRDVTGTRNAGFGMVVIMISPEELAEESITKENQPDAIIYEFKELLQLFPRVPQVCTEKIRSVELSAKVEQS